jgi:hypothetical protein
MTEAEWLACDDVEELVTRADWRGHLSRRSDLFALACVEPLRPHLVDDRLTAALAVLAAHAEGDADFGQLLRASWAARAAYQAVLDDPAEQRWYYLRSAAAEAAVFAVHPELREVPLALATRCADAVASGAEDEEEEAIRRREARRQAGVVRDLFGYPFRPVACDPRWLASDVRVLARGIYADTAFDRMPILADALQDAGCENDDILAHCRAAGQVHVRGCWVVDLLLQGG